MKISKRQFKAALNVAYEAGFDAGRVLQYAPTKVVKRIVKHEAKHAKMRKLKNVRKHWNVNLADHEKARGKNYVAAGCGLWSMRGELGNCKSATLPDLLAEFDLTSTTSDNNESNASKLNETPTKEDV